MLVLLPRTLLATLTFALAALAFDRPPLLVSPSFHNAPPLPFRPPPIPPPPLSSPDSSGCPQSSQCASAEECLVQCRPGWQSLSSSEASCYHIETRAQASALTWSEAREQCRVLSSAADGQSVLPVLESAEELERLAARLRSPVWTAGRWSAGANTWRWATSSGGGEQQRRVNFERLGRRAPVGSAAAPCLVLTPGGEFRSTGCDSTMARLTALACETGSPSSARCAASRRCCAITRRQLGDECFVDDTGTRCEQRVREGFFAVDRDNLVRFSAAGDVRDWAAARDTCRRSGADLAVVNSQKFNNDLETLMRALSDNGALSAFYIGLSSDENGLFSHVNDTTVETQSYHNFESATDAQRASACAYLSERGAWSTVGACTVRRRYICHIGPLRRRLSQPTAGGGGVGGTCGNRRRRGVFGRLSRHGDIGRPHALPDRSQFAEFPWQAAVWVRAASGLAHQFSCSGALLANSWVLAPTHCLRGVNSSEVRVTLGDWNLDAEVSDQLLPVVIRNVSEIRSSSETSFSGYYGARSSFGSVSLLHLSPEIDLSEEQHPHVAPVCLPDDPYVIRHAHHCVATGWQRSTDVSPSFAYHHQQSHHQPLSAELLRKLDISGVSFDGQCQHLAHLVGYHQNEHRRPYHQQPYGPRYQYESQPYGPPVYGGSQFPPFYGTPREPEQHMFEAAEEPLNPAQGRGSSYNNFYPPIYQPLPYSPIVPPPSLFLPPVPPKLCLHDPRCIGDPGTLLVCAVPESLHAPSRYAPPHHHNPYDFARSSANAEQSDAKQQAAGNGDSSGDNSSPSADALAAFVRLFHPPEQKPAAKVKRDTDTQANSTTDVEPDSMETSTAAVDVQEHSANARESHADDEQKENIKSDARSSFYGPPPYTPHIPFGGTPRERYVLVGVAAEGVHRCSLRPMVFDSVLTHLHFVRDVVDQ